LKAAKFIRRFFLAVEEALCGHIITFMASCFTFLKIGLLFSDSATNQSESIR